MQEVNLYQPVSKRIRGALSGSSSRATLVVIVTALAGLWAFAWWQVGQLEKAAAVVRNQERAQAAMSAAAGPQLDGLTDEELEALIASLSTSVETKSRALSLLSGEDSSRLGFSARLRAFGTRHVAGIWLEHLTLGAGVQSIGISGSTLAPELVPRYLQSLAADPALKGGQIDEFVIEKPAKPRGAGGLTFKAGHRGLVAQADKTDEEST
jgi:hypothetical protein